tara:strand:+ start:316 stop:486 length:171 start_codon:yes stop_codon:yes gene_type:complete
MKIGDLVLQSKQIFIVVDVITEGNASMVMVKNIKTGNTSAFPPDWLTKIKTDKFCP